MPEDLRDLPADCICARSAVSPYEGPSYPDEECPVHGTPEPTLMERFDHVNTLLRMRDAAPMPDPTTEAELGRLRNRITALEANGSELLARAERAEAIVERLDALCDVADDDDGTRFEDPMPLPGWVQLIRNALAAPESDAEDFLPVTAATEAHGETTEAQEGSR